MIEVAVDTNVFIASLVEKDPFHEDAIDFMERIETKKCRAQKLCENLCCVILWL